MWSDFAGARDWRSRHEDTAKETEAAGSARETGSDWAAVKVKLLLALREYPAALEAVRRALDD